MKPSLQCLLKTILATLAASLCLLTCESQADTYSKFYDFRNPTGYLPQGGVVVAGGRIYGTAARGGPAPSGLVYSVSTNGADYTIVHAFAADGSEGYGPNMGVTLVGDTLYGTTSGGEYAFGTWRGTVFRVGTNGANFATLRPFAMDTSEGIPDGCGPLLEQAGTLYGVSPGGGLNGKGVIYSITTNGDFHLLHTFSDSLTDGSYPQAPLTVKGSTLYGTTSRGGAAGFGTVYSINTDGSGFAVLHNFAGYLGLTEPGVPMSGLTLVSTKLYGSTYYGGSNHVGTIFSMNLDGSAFTVLHQLGTEPIDATDPSASPLTLVGNQLSGAYRGGGTNLGYGQFIGQGLLFHMNLDGSGFTPLHVFTGAPADGDGPWDGLTLAGNTLYGCTSFGGSSLYLGGSLFSYTLDRIPQSVPPPVLLIGTQTLPDSIGGLAIQVSITMTNLVPGTPYQLLRNPNLTTTNWTPSLIFTATNSFQIWRETHTDPAMFYRAQSP